MDNRKIKLALTVDIMNQPGNGNMLDHIKEVMARFKEVGGFIGQQLKSKRKINDVHAGHSYAIQYENCTVDIDLIQDEKNCQQIVSSFQLR